MGFGRWGDPKVGCRSAVWRKASLSLLPCRGGCRSGGEMGLLPTGKVADRSRTPPVCVPKHP